MIIHVVNRALIKDLVGRHLRRVPAMHDIRPPLNESHGTASAIQRHER